MLFTEVSAVPTFPTDPWFQALIERINASAEYEETAATWEGDITFHVEAEPDKGIPDDVFGYLDLWHGKCRGGGVVDSERAAGARYILRAPYTRWKEIVQGDLDPVRGMVQGKLRVQGDLPTIVRYVNAANVLVKLTGEVDTIFPDEA
jgi:putative sterol carrier protein